MNIRIESALTVREHHSTKIPIPSLLTNLDEMLDGGFHTGKMYQVYGEAGSGKTQLWYELKHSIRELQNTN